MGHLEQTVMEKLWERGKGNVHDVLAWLGRPLAYNTVMTTLDRLYKKGLLNRSKQDRAYIYAPSLSRIEWRRRQAADLVSCLVDSVGQHELSLLDELDEKIQAKRRELEQEQKQ